MYCPNCGRDAPNEAMYCPQCDERLDNVPREGRPTRTGRSGKVTLVLCGLALVLVFVFEVIVALVAALTGQDSNLTITLGGMLGACVALACLGGSYLLRPRRNALIETLRQGWWSIVVSFSLLGFEFVDAYASGTLTIAKDWPLRVLWALAFCLAVGFSEEGAFRGLLFGGMLAAFGHNRRRVVVLVIVESLLFGCAHISPADVSLSDPITIAQAVLKITQTCIYGIFLSAVVLRTRSVLGGALLHGLNNFLLLFVSVGLMGDPTDVSYVSTGEEAIASVILYVVVIALYLPLLWQGCRILREEALDQGTSIL